MWRCGTHAWRSPAHRPIEPDRLFGVLAHGGAPLEFKSHLHGRTRCQLQAHPVGLLSRRGFGGKERDPQRTALAARQTVAELRLEPHRQRPTGSCAR